MNLNNKQTAQVLSFVNSRKQYALLNYQEVIDWYKQPLYKRWLKPNEKPIKILTEIKENEK